MARLGSGHQLNGRYSVEGVVGEGAMSVVYRARDLNTPSISWAIKEMRTDAMSDADRAASEALFHQEATLLARLSHPALPRVVDFFSEEGCHYLVMEHIS